MRLLLANVFVPHLRVRPDIIAQQGNTLLRIEVDHFHTQRAQPIDSTLKVAALADYNRAKTKLPNQTAAIPAGREGSDHDEVTIAALTAGIAKGVRLTVHGGITLLHAPVVACSDNLSARVTDRRADGNTAFGQSLAGFRQRHCEHRYMIQDQARPFFGALLHSR